MQNHIEIAKTVPILSISKMSGDWNETNLGDDWWREKGEKRKNHQKKAATSSNAENQIAGTYFKAFKMINM